MADQTSDDEVFDFSNIEFTREDLVTALNDMVKEYRKLSHSFEEAKAENMSLKSSSIESSSDEFEDIDSLKTELSKLTAENDVLKNETSELKSEIEILKQVVSAWNRSSRSLHKLNESQKLANDKSGLGFNSSEFSEGETSTQSQQAYDKFNKMSIVKANVIYDCFESIKYDDQNSPKLSDNGKAVIYESELVDFFKNGSVRDGLVVSTVNDVPVEISEQLFAETFELPVYGLAYLSEIPKDKIFDARSIVSISGEPDELASILFNILKKMVTAGSKQAKVFAIQISLLLENIPNLELGESSEFPASKILTEKTMHRFVSLNDKVGAEEAAGAPKPKAASKKRPAADVGAPVAKKKRTMRKKSSFSIDNLEIVSVAQEAVPIQIFVPITHAPAAKDISNQPAGETDGVNAVATDVDATAEKIDEQVAEPSADVETSVGESFEPAVEVIEDTALMGPAEEIQEVDSSADRDQPAATTEERHWFDLPYEDLMARFDAERQVVTASDTDEDIEQVDVFTDEEIEAEKPAFGTDVGNVQVRSVDKDQQLREQSLAHGLKWTRTCCSKIVEGSPRDRGAIIARTNTNTKSTCWIRTMIRVDGVWVVEPFCDQWVNIPRPVVCTEVSKQRSLVDFFPTMSEPLRILRKRWADICLEVVGFCASRRLLPVGSLHFCRSLSVVEPVFRVAPRQSPVFAMRMSQFCSVFIDFSLFSWLPTADITDFLSSIALDKTVFRSVQIAQNTVSVAPSVQMLDEPSSSDSSSDDILMDFADQDTAAAANSLPAATTPDVTNALNQLRASIDQIRERDDDDAKTKDTLLLHLSNFENHVIARLDAQYRVLGALRKASNDKRNLLSLELQSSHKQLGTQIVTTGLDVDDIRRVVKETHQELNAKINSLDEQVAATRNDLLEFSAQAQQSLNVITTQLSELVAYINRGGDNKKGESSSSHRPLPTHVHQSEGTG
ncbi:hypothetical protein F511_30724 [Dorcoceras hygrometricum]|uniref:Uncharacterized protein n=1 Tax=Dorcoceras hygrometricum TaxID=472368 RepID=A0A2Z7B0P1_9LAMI|nr:hypothetical protein F511_30724 [Dorcoceras hygrometricum]